MACRRMCCITSTRDCNETYSVFRVLSEEPLLSQTQQITQRETPVLHMHASIKPVEEQVNALAKMVHQTK